MRTSFDTVCCLWLLACVAAYVVFSLRWPMVQDAPLMHYVVFLMHHGVEPYRDSVDMNLPGSYMIEAAVMAVFGPGSPGWRLYDFGLMALAGGSLLVIVRPHGRLAAVLSASLFALIHGRDGVLMTGERDLAASSLLLLAAALLFHAFRKHFEGKVTGGAVLVASMAASASISVKLTLLPLVLCLLAWTFWMSYRAGVHRRSMALVITGVVVSLGAALLFLLHHHAVSAFMSELHGLIPYHASLNKAPLGFLLTHSVAPTLTLFVLWVFAAFFMRNKPTDWERLALLLCALCGLLSYILQRKGFWYQRYPLLAFLLPLYVIDFTRLSRVRLPARCIGFAGLVSGVVLATTCLIHLRRYDRTEPPRPLVRDLEKYGLPDQLQGQVQCMDTIGPCIDALYNARIVQSTGFLYDCYMLDGANPVALDLRQRFWKQIAARPPRLIVVTDSVCYDERRTFDKYGQWPEFQGYLTQNFELVQESGPLPPGLYWSHPMPAFQYRIYLRR